MSLTAALLSEFETRIEAIELVPSEGGRFEVSVNGELIYSKLQTGRHTTPDEVKELLKAHLSAAGQ